MGWLRRALYLKALAGVAAGVPLAVLPRPVLEGVFGHPPAPDHAWVRVAGIEAIALAMLAVLVAHRAETLWWWSWAFAVEVAATAAVATLNVLIGLPAGARAWPWWTVAGLGWALAFGLVLGIAKAGNEAPPP